MRIVALVVSTDNISNNREAPKYHNLILKSSLHHKNNYIKFYQSNLTTAQSVGGSCFVLGLGFGFSGLGGGTPGGCEAMSKSA